MKSICCRADLRKGKACKRCPLLAGRALTLPPRPPSGATAPGAPSALEGHTAGSPPGSAAVAMHAA